MVRAGVSALCLLLVVGLGAPATAHERPRGNSEDTIPAEFLDLTEGIFDPETGEEIPIPAGDAGNAAFVEDPAERIARELAHALGSAQSLDLLGLMPSLYRGKWFKPGRDDVRKCLVDFETNGNYKAVSSGGIYRGAYQFSRRLAIGATWMMQAEVRKEFGDSAVEIVKSLRDRPMQQWNRYWQDRAFWTIWRDGRGKYHWANGVRKCRN
ncbi:MAG: hypothetical protein ACKOBJ_06140 [Actinomycetota bacterium]